MRRDRLSDSLHDAVLERLGFSAVPPSNIEGLHRLYEAWCLLVSFDNIAKMIALREDAETLPGAHAEDFFERWLTDGLGGTCWPTSNALFVLLSSCGFVARRAAAAMLDVGEPNHGSVIVELDGVDWWVDSSMQTFDPLPLVPGEDYVQTGRPVTGEVEATEGGFRVWVHFPTLPAPVPCRLLDDDVSFDFYQRCYEASRRASPFNNRLFARRNHLDRVENVAGHLLFTRSDGKISTREMDEAELMRWLAEDLNASARSLDAFRRCGALAASLQRPVGGSEGPVPANPQSLPSFDGQPPSAR